MGLFLALAIHGSRSSTFLRIMERQSSAKSRASASTHYNSHSATAVGKRDVVRQCGLLKDRLPPDSDRIADIVAGLHRANSGHPGAGVKRSKPSPIWQLRLLMRQSGIVNVEVGIEDRLSLFAYESRLRLYPFAGLLLLSVGQKPRLEVFHDFRVFFG